MGLVYVLAIVSLCIYILDFGTDSWVGSILIKNCHFGYGAFVFWSIFGPSSFFAITWEIMEINGCPSISKLLKSLLRATFTVPTTVLYFIQYLITKNNEYLVAAKKSRFIEVLFEAFPMAILGFYMVFVIQQAEILNIVSITISLISLNFGNALSVTYEKFDTRAPTLKFILSYLAGIIDITFRVLFLSFFGALTYPYLMFLIGFAYVLCFYALTIIKTKKVKLSFNELLACFLTLPSSTYEQHYLSYSLRPKSKVSFNIIALMGMLHLTIGHSFNNLSKFELSDHNSNSTSIYDHCRNICEIVEDDDCRAFSESDQMLIGVLVSLWILLILSTLEGVLEQYWKFMPYCKFLQPLSDSVGYDFNIEHNPIVVFQSSPHQNES